MLAWFEDLRSAFVLNFIEGDRYLLIISGLKVTLIITLFSGILGLAIGFVISVVRATYDMHISEMRGFKKRILSFFNAIFGAYLASYPWHTYGGSTDDYVLYNFC